MGFPRQEYWSGLSFPIPGNLPDSGIELMSSAMAGKFFTSESPEKPIYSSFILTFLVAQMVKCLPAMRETWVQSLGWEDPLEKEMATHSSILAWEIPWREEPGRLQRVRHNLATEQQQQKRLRPVLAVHWRDWC